MFGRDNLISVAEARTRLDRAFSDVRRDRPRETRTLEECLGRVAAEPVMSPEDVPGFSRSTMDGIAIRASDSFGASDGVPAYLQLVGEVVMGGVPDRAVGPGQAMLIPTGGMLPEGADAVVMLEYLQMPDLPPEGPASGIVEVMRAAAVGENVIHAGDDLARGDTVLLPGHRIRPQDIAALASLGITSMSVYARPVVEIFSTGDEIVAPETTTLPPGKVRDCNGPNLGALVRQAGGEPRVRGILPDNEEVLREEISRALEKADMVIMSGGSSVGVRDFAERVIRDLTEPGILFHGVSVRPGKPVIAAQAGSRAVFALPGHPAAVTVAFGLFVEPVLRCLSGEAAGVSSAGRGTVRARLGRNISSVAGREDHVRVALRREGDGWVAEPVLGKSGLVRTMVEGDGIVVIPLQARGLSADENVDVQLFA